LDGLVPQGARYGYDIEVFVGTERFLNNAQREEIREKLLSQYGVKISTGEISNLTQRFLAHIESLHYERAALLRAAMDADGGYPLHIDATTEGGKGTMLVLYSGWRHWALGAWKIPSESSEHIAPHITKTAGIFGDPCAIVRDLGKPMRKAAEEAGEKMVNPPRQLACHFHFLQDIGCGILDESYGRLRELTRSHNIRENIRSVIRALKQGIKTEELAKFQRVFNTLISKDGFPQMVGSIPGTIIVILLAQWILEYRQDSGNTSFPFARPLADLFKRCQAACDVLSVLQLYPALDNSVKKHAQRLQKTIFPFLQSDAVTQTIQELRDRVVLFDSLRVVFKLESDMPETVSPTNSDDSKNINNDKKNLAFEEFEANVKKNVGTFLTSLKVKYQIMSQKNSMKKAVKIVIDHLDNHWQYLWGHPIRLQAEGKFSYRVIERTNNLLETFFGRLKHRERRRSGRKNLNYDFERMQASVAIAANLLDADYVSIMYGSLDSLPSLFSQIDQNDRISANYQVVPSSQDISNNDDTCQLYDMPNNKAFVRKSVFNDWVIAASLQANDSDNDTISTYDAFSRRCNRVGGGD
jgi:hypothetical protein